MTDGVKMLRFPVRCHTRQELLGVAGKVEGVESLVLLVEDEEGVWLMTTSDVSSERVNWMLDRAKIILHHQID